MANIDTTKIKGIIFDYGGTLDSAGDHWSEIIWQGYEAAGIDISKGNFRDAYVYAEREMARTLHILPHHNFRDLLGIKMEIELQWLCTQGLMNPTEATTKAPEIAEYCYNYARNCIDKIRPVLDSLKKSYPLALVSNFYGNINSVLKDFHLDTYFKKIIESAVVGVRKPDPAIFRMGADALGLPPEATLVIGDSLRKDIEPAEKIGCQVIWLKGRGWSEAENAATHPNEIHELGEVLRLLSGV